MFDVRRFGVKLSALDMKRAQRSLRYNENHDASGKFSSGSSTGEKQPEKESHAVGVSDDPNSQSLHTLTGPQQPGETDSQYNDRLFHNGQEHYAPAQNVNDAADNYRESVGLPIPDMPDGGSWTALEAPVEREKLCGDAFAALQSNPDDPDVRRAYEDLVEQTNAQWDYLTKPESEGGAGVRVDFVSPDDIRAHYGDPEGLNPYPTAEAQRNDLVDNHHLAIASISDYPEAYHPLLTNTRGGEYDTFRAVHDAFGHAAVGADFTRHGEFQAWAHHSSMFFGPGQAAASTELTGENSFLVTHHEPAEHVAALLPENLRAAPFSTSDGEYLGPDFFRFWAALRAQQGMRMGGEDEVLKKWGVVDPKNALLGKIARERKVKGIHSGKRRLRYNQNHGEHGLFASGGSTVSEFTPLPKGVNKFTPEGKAAIDSWVKANGPEGARYAAVIADWSNAGTGAGSHGSPELAHFMDQAPVIDSPLYRGTSAVDLNPGFRFTLGPSSFSRSEDFGDSYAVKNSHPTVIEVDGARGLPVDTLSKYPEEQEVISGGTFEVISSSHEQVPTYGDPMTIQHLVVRQLPDAEARARMSWWRTNRPLTAMEQEMSGAFADERNRIHSGKRALRFNEHHDASGRFASTEEKIAGEAADLSAQAAMVEPQVSSDMRDSAAHVGGELKGYDYRLKAEDSLARKIMDKVNEGMTPAQAANSVKDSLRYTIQLPKETYADGIRASSEEMRSKGYEQVEVKNYWEPDDAYQGINSVWQSPEGHTFEVQYHTPESYEAKQSPETLAAYHTMRDTSVTMETRTAAYDFMVENSAQVPIPPDVFSIGQLITLPGVHT